MKRYILLIRLPFSYGAEDAAAVRPQWNNLTDRWKADGTFVTSFVFPGEGYVVSSKGSVSDERAISGSLTVISSIVINALNFEAAVMLAKECPILEQGGTVEVREILPQPEFKTPTQQELKNKEIIGHLYEHILNNRRYALLDTVISPDYEGTGIGKESGAQGFSHTVQAVITAFPDIQWNILDMLADGDKVTVRWRWTATNTGAFRGIPATGKTITDNAIVIYQLQDGMVSHAWLQGDRLGVLTQMGLIPKDLVPILQPTEG